MKFISHKISLGLIFALAGWIPLHGANTMVISSASMGPSQNFSIHIDINNSNAFVAFQFDLPLPSGFTYVTGSALLDPARSNGNLLEASIIPGNKLRVLGYSINNTPFIGNNGSVISFQLISGMLPGTYPLTLTGAVIGDTNSVNILTGSTNGTATLLAPDINITSTLVDFIRTPLGSTTDKTLTLFNTGNQPLNVTGITFTSSYFSVVGSSVFSIPAGQNYNLQIRFTSMVKGVYDKKVIITSNDPDEGTLQVNLQAKAYAVNELRTGNIVAYSGHQGTLTFSINNMEPFTGFQFDLVLPSSLAYVNNSAMLTSRKSNHVVSVNTIPGNKLRVVAFSQNGQVFGGINGNVLSLMFNVNGIGGSYGLVLQNTIIGDTLAENSLSDSFNGTLSIAAPDISSNSQINFGNVSVIETGHQTLRIYNYGTDTLKVEQVTFTNSSYTLAIALPFNILVNQYRDVNISFHQTTRGQSNGIMKIFSNDPDEYPYNVNLSATSYVPNYIIIPNLSAKYIDTVTVPVKITNLEAVVGFQFDIDFPTYMNYIPNSGILTSRAPGYILMAENVTGSKLRVIAFSLSSNPLVGDSGAVVNLKFTIHSTTSQTLAMLTLSNGILGNVLSQNIIWGMTNGLVNIISLPTTVTVYGTVVPGHPECHNAIQIITVAGYGTTYTVPSGSSTTMIAGQKIVYLPGTMVNSGGYMHGSITTTGLYCGFQPPIFDSIGSIEDKGYVNSEQSFFKIYPNPTNGSFILELKGEVPSNKISVDVYGILGETELTQVLYAERKHLFDLSGKPSGVYFIRVISGKKAETMKIVKQ